ncbi:hypothetical protein CHCC20335_4419 [Bacillus paralicheniformis]|nr:hypothetical protein CHCC20335_4419 [Bacillus paralicheniformis]
MKSQLFCKKKPILIKHHQNGFFGNISSTNDRFAKIIF